MYRMQIFEYLPKDKKYNRIHDDKVNLQSPVVFLRLLSCLKYGYKVILTPVHPFEYWSFDL